MPRRRCRHWTAAVATSGARRGASSPDRAHRRDRCAAVSDSCRLICPSRHRQRRRSGAQVLTPRLVRISYTSLESAKTHHQPGDRRGRLPARSRHRVRARAVPDGAVRRVPRAGRLINGAFKYYINTDQGPARRAHAAALPLSSCIDARAALPAAAFPARFVGRDHPMITAEVRVARRLHRRRVRACPLSRAARC